MVARLIDEVLIAAVVVAAVVGGIIYAAGLSDNLVLGGIVVGVLRPLYFVAFEVAQGRSPGKMLFGLRVHGPHGAPKPDAGQSLRRNLFMAFPVIPYVGGILGIVAYVVIGVSISRSNTKQGVHDRFAGGTQVIKAR